MTRRNRQLCVFGLMLLLIVMALHSIFNRTPIIDGYNTIDRDVTISPDYRDAVIPPNIAPLNFMIKEPALEYVVKIVSGAAKPLEVHSKNGKIIIPQRKWARLLDSNKGTELKFDLYLRNNDKQWDKYRSISNMIGTEPIDNYLVYRKIQAVHRTWGNMGIYQRDLRTYRQSEVLSNKYFNKGCVNCHAFANNSPDKMLLNIRSGKYGSKAILTEGSKVSKIGTKFGYIAWHPSGKMAAYSVNMVTQFFHTANSEVRDVIDMKSFLAYYELDSDMVKVSEKLSDKKRMETYPAWSPDGKYLYFCSAPVLWDDDAEIPPKRYKENKYDLMRISYDIDKDEWGSVETVLKGKDVGYSILQPRVSPDGRWLLFCMCDYGSFPVYRKSSDLYLIDLDQAKKTGKYQYRRLDINSEHSESWHSFSSNSRWIAFSSKRRSGEFTRAYFSYIDTEGMVYKPVLLPQKNPDFYDNHLMTFSVPELITDAVKVKPRSIINAIRGSKEIPITMPITMSTPNANGRSPWQQAERE